MKTKIYIIGILSLVLFATSCKQGASESKMEEHQENENLVELTEAQLAQTEIKVGKAEKRIIGRELNVNGMIDVPPQGNISITVPYGGFLKYTNMLPGSRLTKGQLIARVENPDFIEFQREYVEALARNEYLKADFERQETLSNENVSSTKVFQRSKQEFLTNKANIQALESKLRLVGLDPNAVRAGNFSAVVDIYSPINGVVREVYVNTGKYFGPQDVLMDITNAEDLHVELKVYEDDIPLIKIGQRIRFRLANAPEVWMEAEVFLIGNNVRDDRSITIHGHLKEKNEDLLPGIFINAKVEVATQEVYAVPEEAVVRFNGNHYIFKTLGQRMEAGMKMHDFEMTPITLGTVEDGFVGIALEGNTEQLATMDLVIDDAFVLLAKAKNSEEEGGHGH